MGDSAIWQCYHKNGITILVIIKLGSVSKLQHIQHQVEGIPWEMGFLPAISNTFSKNWQWVVFEGCEKAQNECCIYHKKHNYDYLYTNPLEMTSYTPLLSTQNDHWPTLQNQGGHHKWYLTDTGVPSTLSKWYLADWGTASTPSEWYLADTAKISS